MRPFVLLLAVGAAALCAVAGAWAYDDSLPKAAADPSGEGEPVPAPSAPAKPAPDPRQLIKPPFMTVVHGVEDLSRDVVPRLASGALQPATAAVDWRTGAMILSRSGRAAADQLTLTVEEATRSRALTPAFHSAAQAQAGERPVEVTYVRDLPGAVRLQAAGYEIAFSPHASMHVSNAGHAAEAGGVVSIGRTPDSAARRGFVRDEDPSLANASRWYLFVGASGRLVGWSMLRNDDGGWRPVNLSGSAQTAVVTSAQAGLAWRRGPLQTSLAYVRRKVKFNGPFQFYPKDDSIVALSLAIRPKG